MTFYIYFLFLEKLLQTLKFCVPITSSQKAKSFDYELTFDFPNLLRLPLFDFC